MVIEGKKNLSLIKRALLGHITYCSAHALRSSDVDTLLIWDPELAETEALLKNVEINLSRLQEHDTPPVVPPAAGQIPGQKETTTTR